MKIPEMFEAAREKKLKALWVMGEDIVQTDPNSNAVKAAHGKPGVPGGAGDIHDRDRAVRRCHPACVLVPGEERNLHQRRAPDPARERGDRSASGHQAGRTDRGRDHEPHGLQPAGLRPRGRCSRRFRGSCRSSRASSGTSWATTASNGRSARMARAPTSCTGNPSSAARVISITRIGASPTSWCRTRRNFPSCSPPVGSWSTTTAAR